jgi:hypothetical protein
VIAPGDLVDMRGHLQYIVTRASNKKFSLTGSIVITRRHAEEQRDSMEQPENACTSTREGRKTPGE